MIEFRHVYKSFPGPVHALRNLSFEIKKGELVYFIGPSGAGKTTIFKLILGMDEQTAGEISIFQKDLSKMRVHALNELRRKVGVVFQDFKLIPTRTVFENVALPLHVGGVSPKEISSRVSAMLQHLKIEQFDAHFPTMLSGGEQQRVAIARALIHRPELVIADEPTGNLDAGLRDEIMCLLEKVQATRIVITHDQDIIKRSRDRIFTLEHGELRA